MIDCVRQTWAVSDCQRFMFGNGHNPSCERFMDCDGASKMISALIMGIETWAAEEDGVPEFLWDAYSKAHFAIRGSLPKESVAP
jgi:hypothetical protein